MIYTFYTGQEGKMSLNSFLRFCKDFGIFPDLLSKYKIKSNYSKVVFTEDFSDEEELLDCESLVDLLGMCSLDLYVKDNIESSIHKLIFLVDHMIQSKGLEILIERTHKMSQIKQSESCQIFSNYVKFFPEYEQLLQKTKDPLLNKDFFDLVTGNL